MLGATLASALLNNTPVVLMSIPIIAAIASRTGDGRPHMMALSFMAIMGGMLTLIGSSTNLLVADTAARMALSEIGFFDQTIPGLLLLAVGGLYVFFGMPYLLRRDRPADTDADDTAGHQYIIEHRLRADDALVGTTAEAGFFPALRGLTLQMILRGARTILPPFDDCTLEAGDRLFIAATRAEIADALADRGHPLGHRILHLVPVEADAPRGDMVVAEIVVAPGSRLASRSVHQTGFTHESDCFIIGVRRHSRMLRHRLADIRLEAGDVLLVIGSPTRIEGLRTNRDVLLMEWSARELPKFAHAARARLIFGLSVLAAASGAVPIVVAALTGAAAMLLSGILNIRQAARGIDLRIFLTVAAALALAHALLITGGASYLTHHFLSLFDGASPAIILSAFFLICAVITNVMSNNATAILFTPLAGSLAASLNVDPFAFIMAVIFAANCSFATPIAYQTNLMVMTPGNFRFRDFLRAGTPLILLLWLTYSLFAPWYYGL